MLSNNIDTSLSCVDFTSKKEDSTPDATSVSETKPKDLSEIRQYMLSLFHDWKHDDGSLAPLMLRYAWHLCGTYDATSNTGGSNGCTICTY